MLKRILTEPLVHFLVLGALLFFAYGWLGGETAPSQDEIVIDDARIESLKNQFERSWQRPPSRQELDGLVDSWLREEMFYREGIALGLDQGDPVVRRRVAQKMDFISEGLLVAAPDEETLRAWFEEKGKRILGPTRIGAHGTPIFFLHPKDMMGQLTEIMETPKDNAHWSN